MSLFNQLKINQRYFLKRLNKGAIKTPWEIIAFINLASTRYQKYIARKQQESIFLAKPKDPPIENLPPLVSFLD